MRKIIALSIMMPLSAMAETITWSPPSERVDGKPLDAATEIDEYRLYCGEVVTNIPAATTSGEYETTRAEILPGYGTYGCAMTAVDTDGLESRKSNSVSLTWEAVPPVAPTNVMIITE